MSTDNAGERWIYKWTFELSTTLTMDPATKLVQCEPKCEADLGNDHNMLSVMWHDAPYWYGYLADYGYVLIPRMVE